MSLAPSRIALAVALASLAALYAWWFAGDPHYIAVLLLFCLPPLLLSAGVLSGHRLAPFWAGVLALGWFAHAVMVAWSRPAEAGFATAGIALSVAIVIATSWPALAGRFGRRPRAE